MNKKIGLALILMMIELSAAVPYNSSYYPNCFDYINTQKGLSLTNDFLQ